MSTEWLWQTAGDLGRGIDAGQIDPIDLTETYLAAIDAHPLRDRIYTVVTQDRARAEARAAADRAKLGLRRSLLDGVPISWKDLFDTAGVVTEAGSDLLAGRTPDRDAKVLRRATHAGLVCLGKTHMSELAFSGLGYNPVKATPPSVNDPDAVAGGSSSGAAASVAQGLAACGIGSDTGGSVRIPSVWNDLVGLKTTAGRVSLDGVVPLAARFDTVGPLCRSVEDAALMLAALEGTRPVDLDHSPIAQARLMILETTALDDLEDAPRAGFDSAVARLKDAGAQIETRKAPQVAEALRLAGPLVTAEAYGTWGALLEQCPEKMFDGIRDRFRSGKAVLAADFVAGWQRLVKLRAEWHDTVAGYDAVILPTTPNLPPKIDDLARDDSYFAAQNLLALRNTRIGNLLGLASLTLPTGVPSTGIMFLTPPYSEERLLRLGASAERVLS